jgi:hypothetical protein
MWNVGAAKLDILQFCLRKCNRHGSPFARNCFGARRQLIMTQPRSAAIFVIPFGRESQSRPGRVVLSLLLQTREMRICGVARNNRPEHVEE